MTKDQGLYNKPWAAVHSGALAAGTLLQHSTTSQENKGLILNLFVGVTGVPSKVFTNSDMTDFELSHRCIYYKSPSSTYELDSNSATNSK